MQSILFERQHQLGARFGERDNITLPADYGDVHGEYDTLQTSAGLIDLANFAALRVEGRDRVAWLHKLVTANVQTLAVGQGAYSLLLNAKGHVAADFVVIVQGDALLLYTSQRAKEKLFSHLRRAIFREKVALTDLGASLAIFSLQGSRAASILGETLQTRIESKSAFSFVVHDSTLCFHNPRVGSDGFDFIIPRDRALGVWNTLVEHGARPVGFDALNIARIEKGIAWFGDDFDEEMLAPEARLEPFIAENKGCYTGQEVIARIKNRGHVNRLLTQFQIEGEIVPQRGDSIISDGKDVGWITSAVRSFARHAPLALGYLRREVAQNGVRVHIARAGQLLNAQVRG